VKNTLRNFILIHLDSKTKLKPPYTFINQIITPQEDMFELRIVTQQQSPQCQAGKKTFSA